MMCPAPKICAENDETVRIIQQLNIVSGCNATVFLKLHDCFLFENFSNCVTNLLICSTSCFTTLCVVDVVHSSTFFKNKIFGTP